VLSGSKQPQHFDAKTEDSLGDVSVDGELLELFRGYRARATSAFVIESLAQPKSGISCSHYRCQEVFDRLIAWLRHNDVKGNKPLHTLRNGIWQPGLRSPWRSRRQPAA